MTTPRAALALLLLAAASAGAALLAPQPEPAPADAPRPIRPAAPSPLRHALISPALALRVTRVLSLGPDGARVPGDDGVVVTVPAPEILALAPAELAAGAPLGFPPLAPAALRPASTPPGAPRGAAERELERLAPVQGPLPPGEGDGGEEGRDGGAPDPGPEAANAPAPEAALLDLRLVDGRLYPGRPALAERPDADTVVWAHPTLGTLRFSIDEVASITPGGVLPPRPAASEGDMVRLANGDTLRGLVEEIGPTVSVLPEGAAAPVSLAMDRVTWLTLANEPAAPRGAVVWLADGTAAGVDGVSVSGGRAELRVSGAEHAASGVPGPRLVSVPATEVRALVLDAARLRALASLRVAEQAPALARRRPLALIPPADPGAPLFAGDLELPGPMSVAWELPAGAARLAGWLVLPEDALEWGDCEVAVEVVSASDGSVDPVFAARLNAEAPRVRVEADLPRGGAGQRLRVTLGAGAHGPIQDRVLLRGMLLRVD
ncbi:MAG TPA: hypothetical protein VD963_07425 [Phycisphaerales bacterium]|nr:hypothetical protein [Phycisphaerales bacterium]